MSCQRDAFEVNGELKYIFGCTFPVIVCYLNVCLDGLERGNFDIILQL